MEDREQARQNREPETEEPKKESGQKDPGSLEEAFGQLDGILGEMESGDHSLEETFNLYEKGLKLVRYCQESVDNLEKKLIILETQKEAEDGD